MDFARMDSTFNPPYESTESRPDSVDSWNGSDGVLQHLTDSSELATSNRKNDARLSSSASLTS